MTFSPFFLLCATGFFAVFSSTLSKSPVLPLFAAHLGATPLEVGMIAAASSFTGIVVSMPAGLLSDRWGRRRMLLASAAVFASAPFLYPFVTGLWQLAAVRCYHGLATAVFVPVAMAAVSDLFHRERGEKIGWFSTGTLLGRFIAPLAGGSILSLSSLHPGTGYTAVYLACGVAGIAALLFSLTIPSLAEGRRRARGWKETGRSFLSVISHRGIILTSVVEASLLFAYGTFETFLPLYAVAHGHTAYEIGTLLSAQVITLALTKPVMGRFSDRHGRKPQILSGGILGALCIGCFPLFTSFVPLLALSILFGLSLSLVTSATSAFIADLSDPEGRGSAMGVLGTIMDIGHTSGPLFSGLIASRFGFGTAFRGAAVVLIVAALLFGITVRGRRKTPA
ncbi:MAG: MFS transporter [Thermodesulfovibrionales bacterium]